jgi:nicotinamide-nucleotide amidase
MKIEAAIGVLLKRKRWTLSVAESCTGGLVSDRITNVPGSSDYYAGGIVSYSNQSKARQLSVPMDDIEKFGPVSRRVASRMAEGVRKAFGTRFGISTTGVAGPGGGTKKAPVGRVFIAVSDGKRTLVKKETFQGSRRAVKREAAEKSLHLLYEFIDRLPGPSRT